MNCVKWAKTTKNECCEFLKCSPAGGTQRSSESSVHALIVQMLNLTSLGILNVGNAPRSQQLLVEGVATTQLLNCHGHQWPHLSSFWPLFGCLLQQRFQIVLMHC